MRISNKINLRTYTKSDKLGQGGFGTTYVYLRNKEKVAVKELLLDNVNNSAELIENEIVILKKLKHHDNKNILCFKQMEHYPRRSLIITEYLEGKNLAHYYQDMLALGLVEYCAYTMNLFRQLMVAIQFIHSLYIAHYDIKPENIMVTRDGTLKLIDFGLARAGYPMIIVSGFTKQYAPVYYLETREHTWHFNTAKTVDVFCACTTFLSMDTETDPGPFNIIESTVVQQGVACDRAVWEKLECLKYIIINHDEIPMTQEIYHAMLSS